MTTAPEVPSGIRSVTSTDAYHWGYTNGHYDGGHDACQLDRALVDTAQNVLKVVNRLLAVALRLADRAAQSR